MSSAREKVYEDWNDRPPLHRRRSSTINARYQESPSLLFSSMVVHAGFTRGVPGGKNTVPSASVTGVGEVHVGTAQQVEPARSGVRRASPTIENGSSRCTLTFHTCSLGLSRSHWTGRIEMLPGRGNGGSETTGWRSPGAA